MGILAIELHGDHYFPFVFQGLHLVLAFFGWHGLREGLPMLLDSVYILKTKLPHPTPQALHKPQNHCKLQTPQIVKDPSL